MIVRVIACLCAALVGCSPLTRQGVHGPVRGASRLGLVAVLPFREGSRLDGGTTSAAPVPPGLGGDVARLLSERLAAAGVPVAEDARVQAATPPAAAVDWTPALAARVARAVHADLAVLGVVTRYDEREGSDWGARVPASVWYQAVLVRAADGSVVERDRYEETQRSLSENLLALPGFIAGGGRWVTRAELLQRGIDGTAQAFATAIAKSP